MATTAHVTKTLNKKFTRQSMTKTNGYRTVTPGFTISKINDVAEIYYLTEPPADKQEKLAEMATYLVENGFEVTTAYESFMGVTTKRISCLFVKITR